MENVGGNNLYEYVVSNPVIFKDTFGLFYDLVNCPNPPFHCFTKAGKPKNKESDYLDCGKQEKFLIAVLGVAMAVERPIEGNILGISYATCCKCEVKFSWTEVPSREWKGRVIMDYGFLGRRFVWGKPKYYAVDFRGLGELSYDISNLKRSLYVNCDGERVCLGTEDWSFMTANSSDYQEWPTKSYNVGAFDKF